VPGHREAGRRGRRPLQALAVEAQVEAPPAAVQAAEVPTAAAQAAEEALAEA